MTKRILRRNIKNKKTKKTKNIIHHKKKKTNKRKLPRKTQRKNSKAHRGGESSHEFKKQMELRDQFRRMFKTLFTMIYDSQEKNPSLYEKALNDLLGGFKRYKVGINTLIPITEGYLPIDKKTYHSSNIPLIGFVPLMSILIYHLKKEDDLVRLLIQFKRNSGNINLMSIKGNITALSTAIELRKFSIIRDLLTRGADIILLTENNRRKLIKLMPDALETLDKRESTMVENNSTMIENNIAEKNVFQVEENKKPEKNERVITKLTLPSPLPLPENTGYKRDSIPDFWKPIFNQKENELFILREKILNILIQDNRLKVSDNVVEDTWSICKMVQTLIPTYYVPTKKEIYQGRMLYNDLDIDFAHYNMLLCASLIVFGILTDRMIGQDYELIFKGGKAIQLVLAQIPDVPQYISEDIDILILPKNRANDNREEIQNLACHIGYLMKWFLSSTEIITNISILLPSASDPIWANPNIVKISYVKSVKRMDYRKGIQVEEYKPLADIDFKELPEEVVPYFNQFIDYPFYIEELETNVLFVCPYIGALIDEKLYFYSKYMRYKLLLEKGEKITDPGDENVRLSDCEFYLNKFSKAILALSFGLEKKRNPGLSKELLVDKQKKFVMNRLSKLGVQEDVRKKVLDSLFLKESYL